MRVLSCLGLAVSLVVSPAINSLTALPVADAPEVGYVRLMPDAGAPAPAGLAIFGYRTGGVLVTEAGVPSSALSPTGRIFVDVNGPVNTGIAIANPLDQDAVISFYFTDSAGQDFGNGSFTLQARHQMAAFLTEAPFNGPAKMQGTMTFSSTPAVAAIALRGLTNQRGEFLITTLPVAPVGDAFGGSGVVFPHFADGGGWTTQVVLINPGNGTLTGNVQFWGQGSRTGAPKAVKVQISGTTNSTFAYSIAPRSSIRMSCEKMRDNIEVGSVTVTPSGTQNAPSGLVIFSFLNNGITVSTASVPAMPSSDEFRIYVESEGPIGQIGSIQSGLAISNPRPDPATVQLSIFNLDGSSTGLNTSVEVPGGGQIAKYIDELVSLPSPFKGALRLASETPVVVTSLRTRYNERRDLLVTTTPPWDETNPPIDTEMVFPHIVSGGGYTTQLVLLAPGPFVSSGKLSLVSQNGGPFTSLQLMPLP